LCAIRRELSSWLRGTDRSRIQFALGGLEG
jgi:hypothetical protein